jgi:uncharacterized membrane protein required for colicin V production
MTWFDVAVCVLLVVGVATGIRQGFSRTGFGLMAVAAAFLTAAWIYPDSERAFLVCFVAVLIVAGVAGCVAGKVFRKSEAEWLDRTLGGVFGLANGLLFWVLAVVALMAFGPKAPRDFVARSEFAPFALQATAAVVEIMPDEMKTRIERSYAELGQSLPPRFRRPLPALPPAEI